MLYRIDNYYASKIMLYPSIPVTWMTEHDREESKTPRVCFTDSIFGAIIAEGYACPDKTYIVYTPVKDIKTKKITENECEDAPYTGESWYLEGPVEVKAIGKIKVTDDKVLVGYYNIDGEKQPVYGYGYTFKPFEQLN